MTTAQLWRILAPRGRNPIHPTLVIRPNSVPIHVPQGASAMSTDENKAVVRRFITAVLEGGNLDAAVREAGSDAGDRRPDAVARLLTRGL